MAKALKIAALAVGAVALIATGVGAIALGGLAGSLTVAGVSTGTLFLASGGLTLAASLLQKGPKVTASQTDRLTASIDPRTFRKTVLGQTAMPVDVRYEEWSGKDQEICDWIVAFASHAIDGLEEIWFDTEMAWSATTGVVAKYNGYFSIPNLVLEGMPQNAFTFGQWNRTSARLTGCAYARFRFKVTGNSKKAESPFSSGIPSRITVIGRGAKLYDPRRDSTVPGGSGPMRADDQSTWRFKTDDGVVIGENLPLQILRVILGWRIRNPSSGVMKLATGAGVPARRISFPSFQVAANLADELVNRAAGGNEPRYHGAGVISEGDDHKTVLDMLCSACCGRFRDTGGKLALAISHNDLAAAAVDDGLNDDDVIGAFTWDPDPSLETTPNVVRGRYVDASSASLYQLIDYPEVRLPSPDGQDRFLSLDLGVVESPSHAQRVAKQVLQRRQYARQFAAPFDIRAWKYTVGDVLPFTFAPLGFTRGVFRVKEQELGQGGTCNMVLTFETPVFYQWDANDSLPVQGAEPIVYDRGNNPLILAIDEAATTAFWNGVTGEGKPQDNATVGAPTGTSVGGKPAETLVTQHDQALKDIDDLFDRVRSIADGQIDGAEEAVAAAEAARDAAKAAADEAYTNALAAARKVEDASGFATTASGAAQTATQKATEAGQQAVNAKAQADIAVTKAGTATAASDSAAISERNANDSKIAAARSETLSAASEKSAAGSADASSKSASSASAAEGNAGRSSQAAAQAVLDARAQNDSAIAQARVATDQAALATREASRAESNANLSARFGATGGNWLLNTAFTSTDAWNYQGNYPNGNPEASFQTNAGPPEYHPVGENVLSMVQNAAKGGGTYIEWVSRRFPVAKGVTPFVQFFAFLNAHRANVSFVLVIEDANNRQLYVSDATPVVTKGGIGSTPDGYIRVGMPCVPVPDGATQAWVLFRKYDTYPGEASSYAWLWRPYTGEAREGQTTWNSFTPGSGIAQEVGLAQVDQLGRAFASADVALGQRIDSTNGELGGLKASTKITQDSVVDLKNNEAAARIRLLSSSPGGQAYVDIFSSASGGAGVQLGGNVSIHGDLTITGTLQTRTLATNAVTNTTAAAGFAQRNITPGGDGETERLYVSSAGGTMKIDVQSDGSRSAGAGVMSVQLWCNVNGSESALSREVNFSAVTGVAPVSFFQIANFPAGTTVAFFLRYYVRTANSSWSYSNGAIAVTEFKR